MKRFYSFILSLVLVFSILFTTACDFSIPSNGTDIGTNQGTNGSNNSSGNNGANQGNTNQDSSNDGSGDTNKGDGTQEGGSVGDGNNNEEVAVENPALTKPALNLEDIPAYSGVGYIEINNNTPSFTKNQIVTDSYEFYSELDSLGRCSLAVACLGKDLMPTGTRGGLTHNPTGWHGQAIYERSHLIAYALAGEENNKLNLITGTYDLNGIMQDFESLILDYIKETNNHVMYRVEPLFEGDDLLCKGIQMEAYSVEDEGEGVSFNVFIYNAQDDVIIDYATGDYEIPETEFTYILHKTKHKIHKTTCNAVHDMKEENKEGTTLSLEELVAELTRLYGTNWSYCGTCKPQNG